MAPLQPNRRLDGSQTPVRRPHFDITAEALWFRLSEAVLRDTVDLRDLGELAEMHPDVKDAIVRVANDSERAPIRPFDDVTRAMVYIGLSRLRQFIAEKADVAARTTAVAK
jgi:hypothetical protein